MSGEDRKQCKLLLGDIIKGYSVISYGEQDFYIKHFSILDNVIIDEFEENAYKEAVVFGIESQKELLNKAKDYGAWSDKEERYIGDLQSMIDKAKEKKTLSKDPLLKEVYKKNLDQLEKEKEDLNKKRNKIISFSAETLAGNKKVSKMLEISLFSDKDFTKKIKKEDLVNISSLAINKISEFYDHEKMLRVSYIDLFFEAFMYQSGNPILLFNKKFKKLTFYQHRILSYANTLYNKIKNSSYIPQDAYKDAVEIYNHIDKEPEEQNDSKSMNHMAKKINEHTEKEGAKKGIPLDYFK